MQKLIVSLIGFVFLSLFIHTVHAETVYSDNFNDNNTDGWVAGRMCSSPGWCSLGVWSVLDGQVSIWNSDGSFLFNDHLVSSQSVETKMLWHNDAFGGLIIWRKDEDNWVTVGYPWRGNITVGEKWCNSPTPCPRDENNTFAAYPHEFTERKWQTLKVIANSLNGELQVYLDGEYMFTHTVGPNVSRTGLSGFVGGNAGADFDDFRLSIPDSDQDGDGVLDEKDQCPNTMVDTWSKSWGVNRWQVMDKDGMGWYRNKPGKKGKTVVTWGHDMVYTYGCSGNQILQMYKDKLHKSMKGEWKYGLSSEVLKEFHKDMKDGVLKRR